jgi:hypothetical protein
MHARLSRRRSIMTEGYDTHPSTERHLTPYWNS